MAISEMHPVHRFEPWQVWPGSYDNKFIPGQYPHDENSNFIIDKSMPIASMGSCFAREIRKVLIRQGYNYITEETHHPASVHASAAWERTYNTFSMRQIFEYTFESFTPETRWWVSPKSGQIQDPYRRIILYDSISEAEKDFKSHIECSRRAIIKASVLILTLGLTEIWEDKSDKSVICLPSGPYFNEGGGMDEYVFRVSRYPENLDNLEKIYKIVKKYNKDCRLIITISPVHLWATFREDMDVISANCNSKSTLRAVADEFACRHEDVYYFPSYEIATDFNMMMNQSCFQYGKENFHINRETVELIMKHFFRFYSKGEKP
ncbi:MAG: GSCFA domain-containing protein [Deltaproteobacteria bacterium]|nr:GSCFA domain-containing protein [Deltaproteobacteria bacterium]